VRPHPRGLLALLAILATREIPARLVLQAQIARLQAQPGLRVIPGTLAQPGPPPLPGLPDLLETPDQRERPETRGILERQVPLPAQLAQPVRRGQLGTRAMLLPLLGQRDRLEPPEIPGRQGTREPHQR